MHNITLDNSKSKFKHREIKLNLQLNEEEYKILVEGINKYPLEDNFAIWEWMKSDVCTTHHFNTICHTFKDLQNVKLIILD